MTVELTALQRRFLSLAQHDARLRPPNITSVFELFGDLDPDAIQRALLLATERHGLLQVCYSSDELHLEERAGTHNPITNRTLECDGEMVLSEIAQVAQRQQDRTFALEECPLFVGTLFRVNGARWFLIFTVDHLIADGLSIGMLIREMCFVYLGKKRGRSMPLPKTQGTYRDYVQEEAELLKTVGPERRAWWEHELRGFVPAHTASPAALGPIGAVKSTIPAAVFGGMVANARRADVSVSAVVLCAYARAVTKAGLGHDILINKALSSRSENLRGVFGDFMNLVPTRIKAHNKDASQLLQDVRRGVKGSKDNQLPYWTLIERLFPAFYLHPYGICNVWFNYFPPHNHRLVNAPEIGVELVGDLTPAPKWAPCSVCLNVQPMLSDEAEVVILSNTSDVPESTRHDILRELVSNIEQSAGWFS